MEQYDEWMASGLQQYTEAGNLKLPSRRTIMQLILAVWGKLSSTLISNSFKSCILNLNTNGLGDGLIHCFKEGEPCQNGREQLISQFDVLDEPDHPNPFDLITDSDVDEADNPVFRIEEDDKIIDIDI